MKNALRITSFVAVICFLWTLDLQAQEVKETIKAQALKITTCVFEKDYESLIEFTHPAVVEKSGGKEQLLSMVKMTMEQLEGEGIKVTKVDILEPILVSKYAENEYHCLVPKYMEMEIGGEQIFKQKSYLFGWSDKDQKKWVFVEANKLRDGMAEMFIPDFKTNLEIPAQVPPTVERIGGGHGGHNHDGHNHDGHNHDGHDHGKKKEKE